jgi:hypothetical protein
MDDDDDGLDELAMLKAPLPEGGHGLSRNGDGSRVRVQLDIILSISSRKSNYFMSSIGGHVAKNEPGQGGHICGPSTESDLAPLYVVRSCGEI